MHQFSGRTTSLLANYDQSLLVLVLSALAGSEVVVRRCTAVPWRTVSVQDLPASLSAYVAAGNLALIDAKLRDDIDDGGRWYARPVRFWLRRKTHNALAALTRLGFPVALVERLPQRQQRVEGATVASLSMLAEPSAELLAAVFGHGARLVSKTEHVAAMELFGAAVARAVYGLDALDDHDEDRQRGQFNAVAKLAERVGHEAAVSAVRQFVEYAAVEAQQIATQLLPEDRQRMVAAILQQLVQRASAHQDRLLGRGSAAAMRPAEAGDCDCACHGCDCCQSCDCCQGSDSCDGCSICNGCDACNCCNGCCNAPSSKKQAAEPDKSKQRVSGMPMR